MRNTHHHLVTMFIFRSFKEDSCSPQMVSGAFWNTFTKFYHMWSCNREKAKLVWVSVPETNQSLGFLWCTMEKVIPYSSYWEKFSPGHPEETKKLWLHPVSYFISTSMSRRDTQANEIMHGAQAIPGGRITFGALLPSLCAMHWSACIIISSCLMERR